MGAAYYTNVRPHFKVLFTRYMMGLENMHSNKFVDDDAGSYIFRNTNLENSLRHSLYSTYGNFIYRNQSLSSLAYKISNFSHLLNMYTVQSVLKIYYFMYNTLQLSHCVVLRQKKNMIGKCT